MKKAAFISVSLFAVPMIAFAQTLGPLRQLIAAVGGIVAALVPILITLALVVFFFGLVKYLWGSNGEQDHKQGRSLMIWGLIALFVMVSVWGIIRLVGSALNVNQESTITIPRGFVPSAI